MPDPKRLDIGIKVAADTTGATQTTDALKQVDLTASKTYNNIAVAQARTEVAEKNQTDEEKEANKTRAQDALKKIADAEKLAGKTEATAKGIREVGKATKELSKLGQEASNVMQGLAEGGLGGLARAGTGAGNIIRTLASGSIGAVLIPVVAAAGAGLLVLRKIAEQNERDIKRIFDSHAKASQLYQDRLAELTAASKKDFDAQVEDIKKIAAAYDEVTAAIDKAYARQQKIDTANESLKAAQTDTQEKRELAAAKTPEQQAAVKQKFSDQRLASDTKQKFQEFDTVDFKAQTETKNAQEALSAAQQKQAELEELARNADKLAAQKANAADQFNKNPELNGSRVHGDGVFEPFSAPNPELVAARDAAQKDALATREAAKLAREAAEKAATDLDATQKKASDIIQSARETVQENAINRDTFRQQLVGKQIDQQTNAKDLQKQLGQKTAAFQPGDDAALKEIQSLRAQLAAAKGTGNLIGGLLNEDTKNQSNAASQADFRAKAGIVAPKIAGADGKPEGGAGTIEKDGQEIKVTSANTVNELKKVSSAYSDSAKAIEKATPLLTKNAAQNAKVIAEYHASVVATLEAQNAQIASQKQQIDQIRRELQAKADHS